MNSDGLAVVVVVVVILVGNIVNSIVLLELEHRVKSFDVYIDVFTNEFLFEKSKTTRINLE